MGKWFASFRFLAAAGSGDGGMGGGKGEEGREQGEGGEEGGGSLVEGWVNMAKEAVWYMQRGPGKGEGGAVELVVR